ncbi:unnamed protein product [Rotaria magnacalcarata]
MISTPMCCTSDYYSGSDLEYDEDFVKAAPQYLSSTNEINNVFHTLFQYHHSQPSTTSISQIQQSMKLIKLAREHNLSNEIIIRSSAILHHLLLSICTDEIDESIFIACLSLTTKLNEHSTHLNTAFFNSDSLISNEMLICNILDWDIDVITSINYVEAILLHLLNSSTRDRLRQLTYEFIVLCLTDVRCMELSPSSLGIGCLLMACDAINCCDIIPKQVFDSEYEKTISLQGIANPYWSYYHRCSSSIIYCFDLKQK